MNKQQRETKIAPRRSGVAVLCLRPTNRRLGKGLNRNLSGVSVANNKSFTDGSRQIHQPFGVSCLVYTVGAVFSSGGHVSVDELTSGR